MYAIKGTDEDMQCRGFQYEIGKTYKMDDYPILCLQGFHACLNPYDVEKYYPNNGKNRYFLVELGGTITNCEDEDAKVAANEITFIKEVSVDDFPDLYKEFIKDKERLSRLFYNGGCAVIRKGNKSNLITCNGKFVSKNWFDFVGLFIHDVARVSVNYKWSLIGRDGKRISRKWYDYVSYYDNGFVVVKKNGKFNYLNKDGKLISKKWFDYALDFGDKFAIAMIGNISYKIYPNGQREEIV